MSNFAKDRRNNYHSFYCRCQRCQLARLEDYQRRVLRNQEQILREQKRKRIQENEDSWGIGLVGDW